VLNGKISVNNKLERMWKEAVMVYSEILVRHFLGGTEENHKIPVRIDSFLAKI
jgi:hypothetical protein